MDALYLVPKSELVNVKEFFTEFTKKLSLKQVNPNTCKTVQDVPLFKPQLRLLQIESMVDLTLSKIADEANITQFWESAAFRRKPKADFTDDDKRTKTLNAIIERKEKSNIIYKSKKYKRLNQSNRSQLKRPKDLVPYEDVIIHVTVYLPGTFIKGEQNTPPRYHQQFYVLGSNTLAQFRDVINCVSKDYEFFDCSEDPFAPRLLPETNPGFLFIGETFYEDTRIPINQHYSEHFLKWLSARKTFKQTQFKRAIMEETTFMDLCFNMGFPQLFFHAGDCEHLWTFTSMRLLGPSDVLNRDSYPLLMGISFPKSIKCQECLELTYNYVVQGSDRQRYDPLFTCVGCFTSYFYVDGVKTCDFRAYQVNIMTEIQEIRDINFGFAHQSLRE